MPVPDELKVGLEHARDMFKYHAAQRHTSLNYYFVVLGAFVAGFVTLMKSDTGWKATDLLLLGGHQIVLGRLIGTALGIGAIILTLLFWLLDNRNVQLLKTDKDLLIRMERDFSDLHNISEFKTIEGSDKSKQVWWRRLQTYGFLVRAILVVFFILWVAGIFMSWNYKP